MKDTLSERLVAVLKDIELDTNVNIRQINIDVIGIEKDLSQISGSEFDGIGSIVERRINIIFEDSVSFGLKELL